MARMPDTEGFIIAAQVALADHQEVFLHDAEGAPVAVILPIAVYREKVAWDDMPDHAHLEPGEPPPWPDWLVPRPGGRPDARDSLVEQYEGSITRESGLALIEDAQRWQTAYMKARDELADLKEQLESVQREYAASREISKWALENKRCDEPSPQGDMLCDREPGHEGNHVNWQAAEWKGAEPRDHAPR